MKIEEITKAYDQELERIHRQLKLSANKKSRYIKGRIDTLFHMVCYFLSEIKPEDIAQHIIQVSDPNTDVIYIIDLFDTRCYVRYLTSDTIAKGSELQLPRSKHYMLEIYDKYFDLGELYDNMLPDILNIIFREYHDKRIKELTGGEIDVQKTY